MPGARVVIFGWSDRIHVQRWAKGLAGRGFHVKVVSQGGGPIENIETVCLPREGKLSYLKYAKAAADEASKFKPDLVHVHFAGGFGIWGTRTGTTPLVVSVWGSDIIDLPRRWLYRVPVKRTLRAATAITATSRFLKDHTAKLVPSVESKIRIIPFGVNVPDRASDAPPTEPFSICFIKAHEPLYGPDTLLKALARVKQVIPDITLNMAGNGSMTPHLRQLTAELKLEPNVNFPGFIDNPDIPAFVGKHHAMVMPSLKEAFGVAVLEASACERPVIATDVGGVSEVLVDNVTGILVPVGDIDRLADAIIRLARDAEMRATMGRAGRRFVEENYTWDKSLDLMIDLYERLLHEKK